VSTQALRLQLQWLLSANPAAKLNGVSVTIFVALSTGKAPDIPDAKLRARRGRFLAIVPASIIGGTEQQQYAKSVSNDDR